MLIFEKYKELLFPDSESQNALIKSVNDAESKKFTDWNQAYAFLMYKIDEDKLQKILAPFLRARAINHLSTAQTTLAKGFRDEFEQAFAGLDHHEAGDVSSLSAFFQQQGKAFVYATDIEAGALAESLGVNFACTRVGGDNYSTSEPMFLYYRAPNKDALTVHLFNRPGTHFFIHEGQSNSTLGDGNCLYNGFSQILHQAILFEDNPEMVVCYEQYKIFNKIQSATPLTLQNFIANIWSQRRPDLVMNPDYQLALELAKQDGNFNSITPSSQTSSFSQFKRQIQLMEAKGNQLATYYSNSPKALLSFFDMNYKEASDEALGLAKKLGDLLADYEQTKVTPKITAAFKEDCLSAIDTASKVLAKHRGFKKILRDLIETLFSGLPYIYNQWTNGCWFFNTPTDSSIQLDELSVTVNQIAP